jgi:hypothetical protein
MEKIDVHHPLPPCFAKKNPEDIENKGPALQKATKSSEVADNTGDTLRVAEISSFERRTGRRFDKKATGW